MQKPLRLPLRRRVSQERSKTCGTESTGTIIPTGTRSRGASSGQAKKSFTQWSGISA
jgi:hypothetical protein